MAVSERTWPTATQIEEILSTMSKAVSAVDDLAGAPCGGYIGLVEDQVDDPADPVYGLREGVPQPSYTDMGVLAVFIESLKHELGELRGYIDDLERVLYYSPVAGVSDDA